MAEFTSFAALGFLHITDLSAADHLLFLVALGAIYRGREWRDVVWVVTAFTAGHSLTLALAAGGGVKVPDQLIEFLIPLTILATVVENIAFRHRSSAPWNRRYRPLLAGIFGLVHGAGFAGYLRTLFEGPTLVPLLGFNLGVELGQIVLLAGIGLLFTGLDRIVAPRLRTVTVSAAVGCMATWMALERVPW